MSALPRRPVRTAVIACWLLLLLAGGLYCFQRGVHDNAFESNILSLLPDSVTGQPFATDAVERRFVILVSHPDRNRGLALAQSLQADLARDPLFTSGAGALPALSQFSEVFAPYRHQLLAAGQRSALQTASTEALTATVLDELYAPVTTTFRLYPFADDPLNLGGNWLQSVFPDLSRYRGTTLPALDADGKRWHLVFGEVLGSPFSLDGQEHLANIVDALRASDADVELLQSGLIFHAGAASRIARFEISLIGNGSLLGIVLLVLFVFRSGSALGAIGFTLLSSFVVALSSTFLVFGKVHLITVAFGSTLLGLAVDYALHFLVKQRTLGDPLLAGRHIRRGLLISAGSTSLALLLQLFSPFPGLRQFAVFVCAGLVGACIAIAVLAFTRAPVAPAPLRAGQTLFTRHILPGYQRLAVQRSRILALTLLCCAVLGALLVWRGSNDSLRQLNTSSPALLASEQQAQALLQGPDTQRYLQIRGNNIEQVLQREHALLRLLARDAGVPPPFALSTLVPPRSTQQEDFALVAERIYGADGIMASVCARLSTSCTQWPPLSPEPTDYLLPQQVPADIAALYPPLASATDTMTNVLLRQGTVLDTSTLDALRQLPGVTYVDQVDNLTTILARYRIGTTLLLAGFLLCLLPALRIIYGGRALFMLCGVLLSVLVGIAAGATEGLTLFHVLALLLVAGLTVDACVFYQELGFSHETWLAATLAALTSLLAFGLLSFSKVPPLHYFGNVVFYGLLCGWLVTPLFFHLAVAKTPASTREP